MDYTQIALIFIMVFSSFVVVGIRYTTAKKDGSMSETDKIALMEKVRAKASDNLYSSIVLLQESETLTSEQITDKLSILAKEAIDSAIDELSEGILLESEKKSLKLFTGFLLNSLVNDFDIRELIK